MPVAAQASVPASHLVQPGWEAMCARGDQPMNFCKAFSGPAQVTYSPKLAETLLQTNEQINDRYSFRSDKAAYGDNDHWSVPTGGTADCEDYVLAKIQQLKQSGVSVSAMTILVGSLRNGEWHAVLGVQTDQGMVVLDSMTRGTTNVRAIGFDTKYYMAMNDSGNWHASS